MNELADLLDLGPLLAQPVRTLSLGQRMRSELAAAVLPAPKVLFLDEPTIGLDVEAKAAVRAFLRELNRVEGTTMILTTHDLDDIAELCGRLIVIDHGRIVYDATVDDLHTTFASTRMLVVDLADPAAIITPSPGWADAEVSVPRLPTAGSGPPATRSPPPISSPAFSPITRSRTCRSSSPTSRT